MSQNTDGSKYETQVFEWVGKIKKVERIQKLPGDASTRVYFRVFKGDQSWIAMKMEEDFIKHGQNLPFLAVQKHLKNAGVKVPEVLEWSAEDGLILLQDLSDVTLLRILQEVGDAETERLSYEKVIDELAKLHVKATPRLNPGLKHEALEAFELSFDHAKLMWEVDFTMEHFYQKYLARKMPQAHIDLIRGQMSSICHDIAAFPTVFTHRDFHSRNIMVPSTDQFFMIDFQDARMGPPQYDLASLLKDSYYQLDSIQADRLVDYYIARFEALSGQKLDSPNFKEVFDLMAIQRNFKAIGSFASFLNRRGNPAYLKFIGNTFENIRRTLLKYPKFKTLRETLFHYYYF